MTIRQISGGPYIQNARVIVEVTASGDLDPNVETAIVISAGVTLKLPSHYGLGIPIRIVAVGGNVMLDGNGHAIVGGGQNVLNKTTSELTLTETGEWVPISTSTIGGGRFGLLPVDVASASPLVVSMGMLLSNPAHPGVLYEGITLIGDSVEPNIISLPTPISMNEMFELTVENRSTSGQFIRNDGPDGFLLVNFRGAEVSLEQEIQNDAQGYETYRTRVMLVPEGAYRVPGFSRSED